jgi:transposase
MFFSFSEKRAAASHGNVGIGVSTHFLEQQVEQAARRLAVSPSAAIKLMQRVAATGGSAPEPSGGRRPLLLGPHADMLKAMVEAERGITLVEIQAKLERGLGMTPGLSTIRRMRRRLGLRLKKKIAESG